MQGAGPGAEPRTATATAGGGNSGQHPGDAPPPRVTARKSPPRLDLNGMVANRTQPQQRPPDATGPTAHPCLVVEPASPAPAASAAPPSAVVSTTPFPLPIPSTSTATATSTTTAGHAQPQPYAGSFLPPPSPQAQGGGLAARRAAKLGKKRLSLLVPANPHSSVPVVVAGPGPGPDPSAFASPPPLTPSFLLPASLKSPANGFVTTVADDAAAETRSLPPSPLSLTTFIGPEGSEAPDRTIGRLMLKQQADEMREQMRGKRGMKRRTSIPRLNLVKTGVAQAQPANLDAIASQISCSTSSALAQSTSTGSRSAASSSSSSAVQFLRSAENGRARSSSFVGGGDGSSDGPVEEFPYALGPREILPGIYLGSEQNAKDAAVLRDWRIRFVLNVAKEVECPWLDEVQVLAAQDALDRLDLNGISTPAVAAVSEDLVSPRIRTPTARRPSPPRRAQSHTTDASPIMAESPGPTDPLNLTGPSAPAPLVSSSPTPPVRPTFMRPTASTPNLQAAFDPLSSPPPPPVPPLPDMRDLSAVYPGLSESPPPPEAEPLMMPPPSASSAPERDRAASSTTRSSRHAGTATTTTQQQPSRPGCCSSSTDTIRIPSNPGSGRPELDYLWLKWGHDESDLVEAKKFQAAFDFLDEARERDGRVLVHCQCGVSRSATVVIAYCMREAAKALEEGREAAELAGCTGMHDTYSFVKEKSEWVGPNLSLVFQLVAYERTLRGDSINGDDDLSEPPSAAFRSEPPASSPLQSDMPPASPLDVERPFAFPPPLSARPISRMVNGTLASPHTPVSDASLAYSQMSTPELRDPLLSPALSSATKSSSVTSTPLSPERQYNHLRPTVRIVHSDGDDNDQSRGGGQLEETVLVNETARKAPQDGRVGSVFVLPVPPHGVQDFASPTDLVSPTVAKYPHAPTPTSDRQGFPPSAAALSPNGSSSSSSSFRSGLPLLAPVASSPLSTTSAPALPSLQVRTEHLPSPFSPSSSSTASTTLSPLSGSTTASPPGRTPSSSSSHSHDGSLARSHSGRRFGAGQSRSERRASHRRVCSDTIRVPTPLGFTSTASSTTPILSSGLPSSAGTTPRAGTPAVDVGSSGPR